MRKVLLLIALVSLVATAADGGEGKGGRGASGEGKRSAGRSGENRGSAAASRRVLEPKADAGGDHTVYKYAANTATISRYETYRRPTDPRDPRPFKLEKAVDLDPKSAPHYDKGTQRYVPIPHVREGRRYRDARPEEVPKKK